MATLPHLTAQAPAASPPRAVDGQALLDLVIWLMICSYLLVDTASGFMRQLGANEALLSQAWKGGMLALILIVSFQRSAMTIAVMSLSLLLLLCAPFIRLFVAGTADDIAWEVSTALKPLLPLAVLCWCADQRHASHNMLRHWPRRALWMNSGVVFGNVALGIAGLGFSSYATYTEGSDGIGSLGYFYAANEVGAVFAVLCGFVFMEMWNRHRRWYLPVTAIAVLTGFAIATKSAIISALLLAPLIPLAYQRGRWLRMPASMVAALAIATVLLITAAVRIWTVLEAAGLSDRIEYIYNRQGWLGIILSGRNIYAAAVLELVQNSHSFLDAFIGPGLQKLNLFGVKESIEMDPFDFYLWFGAPGVIFFFLFVVMFMYPSAVARRYVDIVEAPAVHVTTLVLLAIAVIAGHVILGAMAGVAWAALVSLTFVPRDAQSFTHD